MEEIINKIKENLHDTGLVYADIGQLTGYTRQHISAIFLKTRKPSAECLLKLSVLAGVDIYDGLKGWEIDFSRVDKSIILDRLTEKQKIKLLRYEKEFSH